jgi:probable rRNA maturation factor
MMTLQNNNKVSDPDQKAKILPLDLSILPEAPQWETEMPGEALHDAITKAVTETLLRISDGAPLPPCELTILLTDDAHVQELNRDFRHQDKPTNVLSFPNYSPGELKELWDGFLEGREADTPGLFLGDMAMAFETIAREAKDQNKTFPDHLTHLVVHGTLHLLGYDHMDEKEAQEMESLEIEILQKLNIANPYEEK